MGKRLEQPMGPMARRHNVRMLGEGPKTVVLGHGFGTDQSAWRHVVPSLAAKHRVLSYDLACSGSVAPDVFDLRRHRDLDGYARDLGSILNEFRIDRCVYVGHSVSAMIGLLAAWQTPERFEHLIMLAPSPRYLNDAGYHGGFERKDLEGLFDAIASNYRQWTTTFAPFMVQGDIGDPAVQEFGAGLLKMRPDIALSTAITIFESDLRDKLPGFPIPVTVLQTRNDPAVPMSVAEYLHRQLPNSSLELVDAEGHLPHLSAPAKVNEILRRLL